MNFRSIIFLVLTVGVSACRSPNSSEDQEGIKKERCADAILHKVAAQLKQEKDLRPMGTMGQMLYDIEKLGLSFYYYKPVDIIEGRKLLIQAVNAMLDEINQNKPIQPYLCRHPFLPWNVGINIFLRNPDESSIPNGALCVIGATDGFLCYDIHHPVTGRLITVYKETFDEALQRLADPSLPLIPFEPDPEIGQEEWNRLRKGISLLDDGSLWHLDEHGSWVRDPQPAQPKE